eukprot:CAMPEP_0198140760 /NCGR_PEP_ID=MMETSP1443-20131203/3874_1 /TAXON_ID=186043 /ORGANISM="Entomoneis sp., Strain CCMP2396" /LENGTH=217 /DNA_ID=CAMNT_0043803287 /DNA_START=74 /DNA_END=727 /DNA_ORIENTATION=+
MKISLTLLAALLLPSAAIVSADQPQETTTSESAELPPTPLPLSDADQAFIKSLAAESSEFVEVETGVYMKILTKSDRADGQHPTLNNDIKSHFTGKLPDGSVFDSSHDRGSMMQVPLSHTLKGWQKALPLMKEGDKADVCMTPEWAFGEAGAPPHVQKNQVVCYEIHLEEVMDGDKHHYIHPDYAEYAEQYKQMLEEQQHEHYGDGDMQHGSQAEDF